MNNFEAMKERVLSFLMQEVENLFRDEAYMFEVEDVINYYIKTAVKLSEHQSGLNLTAMLNDLKSLDEKYYEDVLYKKVIHG